MGRPLLERMAIACEEFYRTDKRLVTSPSLENHQLAKEAIEKHLSAQKREYLDMLVVGDWDQKACDNAIRLAEECADSYREWLVALKEKLLSPEKITEVLMQTVVVNPIAPQMTPKPAQPIKPRGAFF